MLVIHLKQLQCMSKHYSHEAAYTVLAQEPHQAAWLFLAVLGSFVRLPTAPAKPVLLELCTDTRRLGFTQTTALMLAQHKAVHAH